jgi:hypothetical protein
MKNTFITFLALIAGIVATAQPRATEGSTDFQKTSQPAAIIELPYPQNIVDKAIDDYMAKRGVKGSNNKDFRLYRGVKINNAADLNNDLYFKTDYKSRREKDITIVSLVVAKNGEDVKARVAPDNSTIAGATDFLNDLAVAAEAYNLEVMVKDQEDLVKKSQRKYDNLVDDQKDYEKKIRNLQDKIESNKQDQQKQLSELQKQQGVLEVLKAKRKSQ